jgi:hypothetical protein
MEFAGRLSYYYDSTYAHFIGAAQVYQILFGKSREKVGEILRDHPLFRNQ